MHVALFPLVKNKDINFDTRNYNAYKIQSHKVTQSSEKAASFNTEEWKKMAIEKVSMHENTTENPFLFNVST